MIVSRPLPLILAAGLLVAQPVMACCCLGDLEAEAHEAPARNSPCHGAPASDRDHAGQTGQPTCSDCVDYETAPAEAALKSMAPEQERSPKLLPAHTDGISAFVRAQSVRITGPPPPVRRPALTPVILKQRLLI